MTGRPLGQVSRFDGAPDRNSVLSETIAYVVASHSKSSADLSTRRTLFVHADRLARLLWSHAVVAKA